ncbi:ABC transporter permease [Nocardioides sp. CN2-186]|uniref:ABC transporter permease n=1 Tax=Nocardioides tweenelious TaxID=3156607 RepID=UPI0032B47DFC
MTASGGRYAFVGRRLLQTVPLLLAVTLLVFLITKVSPGNPARTILGPKATDEQVAQLSHQLGYDRSVLGQYFSFLGRLLHGDLGTSARTGDSVGSVIGTHLAPTVWLVAATLLLTVVAAVPLAWTAATHRDGWLDHLLRTSSIVVLYLPTFWVGLVLIRFVALPTGWFPVSGFGETTADHLRSVVLPAVSLALALAPVVARSLRTSMVDVLESDYVMAARATGVSGWRLFRWCILRNSMSPAVSLLAVQVGFLLFGVVVLEVTFDIHGLGSELVTASVGKDLLVTQGITLVFAIAVVAVNLVADLLLVAIDPRVTAS